MNVVYCLAFLSFTSTAPCYFPITTLVRRCRTTLGRGVDRHGQPFVSCGCQDRPARATDSPNPNPRATKYVRENKMTRRRTSFLGSSICQAGLPGPVDPHDRARNSDLHGSSCRDECRDIDRSRKPSLDLNPSGSSPISRTPSPLQTHKEHMLNMG